MLPKIHNTIKLFIAGFSIIFISCFLVTIKNKTLMNDNNLRNVNNKESNSINSVQIDYEPVPLAKLIGISELIATGYISKIIDSNYVFVLKEILSGKITEKSITVNQYFPSKFEGKRRIPYAINQSYILFLQTSKKNKEQYSIIGYGGEGEMLIENGFVYFMGIIIEGLEKTTYEVQGKNCYAQRFDFENFKNAVSNYSKCFKWQIREEIKNNKSKKRWVPSLNCSQDAINDYKSKSWIHQYLVQQTQKNIPKKQ